MKKLVFLFILLVVILLVGYVGLELYAVRHMEMEIERVTVDKISPSRVDMTVVVTATNRTPIDCRISRENLEIHAYDRLLATVDRQSTVSLPSMSPVELSYPVEVDSASAIRFVWKQYIMKKPTSVKIKGRITLESRLFGLEFTLPIEKEKVYQP